MNIDPACTYLVYDGDCPACRNYVQFMRFCDAVGPVQLINARQAPDWVAHLNHRNMPLDEGMVLVFNGRYYFGADAIHHMALLSSRHGMFNRINAGLFRSPRVATFLYPVLRTLRNGLLRVLGRTRIQSSDHV